MQLSKTECGGGAPPDFPDLGCCFETSINGAMIELETLGPLASRAPGQRATPVEF